MADKKISALTGASTPLTGSEVLPIVQSGSTVKVSAANITAGRDTSALVYRAGLAPNDQSTFPAAPAGGLFLKNNAGAGVNTVVARLSDGTYPNSALPTVEFTAFGGGNGYAAAFWATQFGGLVFATADTFGGTYTPNITLANGASGDATVNKGNLVVGTAGKGIDFSANTHAAGMTSELLNDYEEGTWTAVITDGTNNATMGGGGTCQYTKIGRLVTLHGYIYTTSLGSVSGDIKISGLPFTPLAGSTNFTASSVGFGDSLAITAGQSIGIRITPGSTTAPLYLWDAATGSTALQAAEWTFNGEIMFTATYIV